MTDIKKISSEDLLQELIDRKVLTQIPVGLYKEFELKRKYRDRDKPIHYDGVFLLNSSQKSFNDELSDIF
jgi:hypothetical protein|nr:MAG TPA: hypothetical protein [Caudoviricetes sp.]